MVTSLACAEHLNKEESVSLAGETQTTNEIGVGLYMTALKMVFLAEQQR